MVFVAVQGVEEGGEGGHGAEGQLEAELTTCLGQVLRRRNESPDETTHAGLTPRMHHLTSSESRGLGGLMLLVLIIGVQQRLLWLLLLLQWLL